MTNTEQGATERTRTPLPREVRLQLHELVRAIGNTIKPQTKEASGFGDVMTQDITSQLIFGTGAMAGAGFAYFVPGGGLVMMREGHTEITSHIVAAVGLLPLETIGAIGGVSCAATTAASYKKSIAQNRYTTEEYCRLVGRHNLQNKR